MAVSGDPVDWRIQLSSDACPVDVDLKEKTGLPWGCVVRPFASAGAGNQLPVASESKPQMTHAANKNIPGSRIWSP